jgi:dienelactone hydrolase
LKNTAARGIVANVNQRAMTATLGAVRRRSTVLALLLLTEAAQSAPERELIRDPGFRRGFTVLQPQPGKRVPYGVLHGHQTASPPVWDLDQWSSKHPLAIAAPESLADGSLRYSNVAKTVILGAAGAGQGDLGLAVRANVEYGARARKSGEPWVHLLVEQSIANPPSLAELSAARLHVEARLKASERRAMPDYSPGLHAAQFQIFFSVQNLNRQSPGFGKYLWFGIPLYDDRHHVAPSHKAQDTGGTSMFIYTPSGDVFSAQSAHEREWLTIDRDLLPLMREGLEYAWRHNFLKESQALADYRIAGMNIGWEVPGTFDVDLGIRRLSLKAVFAERLERTNLFLFQGEAGAVQPVKTIADWQKRRASILEAMQRVMGPLPGREKRGPLEIQNEEEVDCGSYLRRRISYAAEPHSRVPAYLLIPKKALAGVAKAPAILALHQTHPLGQKVVVGLGNSTNDEYGVELAQRGFVVLAPPYPLLADYNPDLNSLGYESGTMKAIWDNIRGIDVLESLPFVRTNGFGAIGHSLGGHNSIYTAVFDERIKVVVSSCGFDSYVDYKDGNIRGWTSERYMPRLLDFPLAELPFDFYEMIAALAPRACFINAPLGDTNFKWRSVDRVVAAAARVYALYGRTENLRVEHPDCAHLFPREMRETAYKVLEDTLP